MRNITPLSVEEIRHALNFLISHTQLRAYPEEVTALRAGRNINAKSTIRKLSPYIDDYKVLRVGGRLDHAPIPLDARHPVILPSKSRFTVLVLRNVHMRLAHASAKRTLHETWIMYWIIRGRSAAKSAVSKCFPCSRLSVKAASPQVSALPTSRIQVGRPANDDTETEVLTSNDLLLGRANPKIPFDLFNDADLGLKKRWRFAEALATNFWKRSMKEFLPTMAERQKIE